MSTTRVTLTRAEGDIARIRFDSDNGIQILSVNVCDELEEILKSLQKQPARIVVLEATGRTFLAGANLQELRALNAKSSRKYSQKGQKLFSAIEKLPCITVAAIHAACVGGGCEMSLACDFRFMAKSARIGLPEVTLGILPGWGGTVRATQLLGPVAARRFILSGELLPSDEAYRIHLVDAVFDDADFAQRVNEKLASLGKASPFAVKAIKETIASFSDLKEFYMYATEAKKFAQCYAKGEPAEGIAAFLEKRTANFSPLK